MGTIYINPGLVYILPSSIATGQKISLSSVVGETKNIIPGSILSKQIFTQINITSGRIYIYPGVAPTGQTFGTVTVSNSIKTIPSVISTGQNFGGLGLTNVFYDELQGGSSFDVGDTDSYNWQNTNSLGLYAYERPASIIPGYKVFAYRYTQARGPLFFFSAYLKTNADYASNTAISGFSAIGVGIQSSNVNNGYL